MTTGQYSRRVRWGVGGLDDVDRGQGEDDAEGEAEVLGVDDPRRAALAVPSAMLNGHGQHLDAAEGADPDIAMIEGALDACQNTVLVSRERRVRAPEPRVTIPAAQGLRHV